MRALVIDDDIYCLNLSTEYFKYKGFEVTALLRPSCEIIEQVVGGEKGTREFDIIISDNRMPGMTGIEFFEKIDAQGCVLPVQRKALMTGDISQAEFDRAKARGITVFNKPCPLENLDQWLKEALN